VHETLSLLEQRVLLTSQRSAPARPRRRPARRPSQI